MFLSRLSLVGGDNIDTKQRFADRYRNDRWNSVERCKNNGRANDEVLAISNASREYNEAFYKVWSWLDPLFSLRGFFLGLFSLTITGWGLWLAWKINSRRIVTTCELVSKLCDWLDSSWLDRTPITQAITSY
jgi:hypothetical protein